MKAKIGIIHARVKEVFNSNKMLKEEKIKVEKEKNNVKKDHVKAVAKMKIHTKKEFKKKNKE